MKTKYKHIQVVFNNGVERNYKNAYISNDTRCWYITQEGIVDSIPTVDIIPMYNVLYLSEQGKLED